MNIRTKEARTGDMIVFLICVAVILLCLLPMINLLAQSLSSSDAVINGRVSFLPVINKANTANEGALDIEPDNGYTDDDGDYSYSENSAFVYDDYEEYSYEYEEYSYEYDDSEDYSYSYDEDSSSASNSYTQTDEEYQEWLAQREALKNKFRYGATLESYRYVFMDPAFTRSMWWTAILTVICTFVSLTMTILCAYPLTYEWIKGKTFINTLIIFTMYFSAGTIPNYILMKDMGFLDNPLVLIIPNCLSVFNMIILRSFFFGIPDSLRESAELDGANPFTVLVRIYLPLSAPVLATLALFYAVGRWNGFSDALLYIKSAPQWVPIQLKLWQLIQNMTSIDVTTVEMVAGNVPRVSDAIKAAAIMFATVPILIVYPWLQRYFIEGVTIGAVKG
ncbi:MAG: carbohydrate ABC transporter permease [Treponema sp.]|jgi:putative aldouronate transport system permease protein|nr:carbohydrate ABC transporter permease [Treponema sp.]